MEQAVKVYYSCLVHHYPQAIKIYLPLGRFVVLLGNSVVSIIEPQSGRQADIIRAAYQSFEPIHYLVIYIILYWVYPSSMDRIERVEAK